MLPEAGEGVDKKSSEDELEIKQSGGTPPLKGLFTIFVYRSNLIFWIVMGCGIADFGQRGL